MKSFNDGVISKKARQRTRLKETDTARERQGFSSKFVLSVLKNTKPFHKKFQNQKDRRL